MGADKVFLWWKMHISVTFNEGVSKINMKKESCYDKKFFVGMSDFQTREI